MKRINPSHLRFAKVILTLALPFIVIWYAVREGARAAWNEARWTVMEYRDHMKKTEIDL